MLIDQGIIRAQKFSYQKDVLNICVCFIALHRRPRWWREFDRLGHVMNWQSQRWPMPKLIRNRLFSLALFKSTAQHSIAKVDCSYETLDSDSDSRCFWLASLKREKREDRRETWEKRCLGERQTDKPGEKYGEMRWLDLSHFSLSYNFTNCECPWISST